MRLSLNLRLFLLFILIVVICSFAFAGIIEETKLGNVENIKKMINNNKGVLLQRDSRGYNALMVAIENDNANSVSLLIGYNQLINERTGLGLTPLHIASANINDKFALKLIDAGSDLYAKTYSEGNTPLHLAICNGRYDIINKCTLMKIDSSKQVNYNGETLLMIGAEYLFADMFEKTLKIDDNFSACDNAGNNVYHYAVKKSAVDVYSIIKKRYPEGINLKNNMGLTPLNYVILKNSMLLDSIVDNLVKLGADTSIPDNDGNTPLINGVKNNNDAVVNILLKNHANPDIRNRKGETALHIAVYNNNLKMVNNLLANGAKVDICNNQGCLPVHYARSIDIAQLLIKQNPKTLEFKSDMGDTPLLHVCLIDAGVANELINIGADIKSLDYNRAGIIHYLARNCNDTTLLRKKLITTDNKNLQDIGGWSPLHESIVANNNLFLRDFLTYKPNLDLQDYEGNTPIHLAIINNNDEAVALLLESGAKKDINNKTGELPISLARKLGKHKIIKLLQ